MPLVTSTQTYFIDGSRIRPGKPFDWKGELRPDMKLADGGSTPAPAPAVKAPRGSRSNNPKTLNDIAKQDAEDMAVKGQTGDDLV